MTLIPTNHVRRASEHFEPEAALSPQQQRGLRGHLEQIDYAAFAANRELLAKAVGEVDLKTFERLAVASAQARGRWIAAAILAASRTDTPPEEIRQLDDLRRAYENLADAYEGLRRLVERGYVTYRAKV